MKTKFIFVGRVSKEKGMLLIVQAANILVKGGITNFQIDIVGNGELDGYIRLHPLFQTHIFCHGRLPKNEAMHVLQQAHFTLMPSLFLETFGLTALDSLAFGIPVIGSKKGGLTPFIYDDCCDVYDLDGLTQAMQVCIQKNYLGTQTYSILQKRALEIASGYTPKKRIDTFGQLSKNCKKCLLISDYAVDIGGLENYLAQVKELLQKNQIKTTYRGKTKRVVGWRRKVDLLVSGLNLFGAQQIFRLLKNDRYDLIWIHSIQRWIGRLGLCFLYVYKKQPIRVMYHDFGLFHPFPSGVYTEDNLQRAKYFVGYLMEGKHNLGPLKRRIGGWLLIVAKYVYTKWLWYRLHKMADSHLVPSPYLTPYVRHWLGKECPVQVFPHFVSHAHDV